MKHQTGGQTVGGSRHEPDGNRRWSGFRDAPLARLRGALAERAVPIALSVSLILTCLITSQKKGVWTDEVWSITLLREPSLGQLLRNLSAPADSAQPLYYTLAWLWWHVAGAGETSLRLMSALAVVAGIWLVWAALRRVYPLIAVSVGVVIAVATSELLLYHVSEIRFYGLLTGVVAFNFFLYTRIATRAIPTRPDLVLQFLAASALVFCHITGWLYSGALLAAYLLVDWRRARFRPRVYGAVILGWATFAAWLPAFIRQAGLAKPHSNLRPPTITDIISIYQFDAKLLPLVIFLLVLLIAVTSPRDRGESMPIAADERVRRGWDWSSDRVATLLGGVAILAVPAAAFVMSRAVTPMLLPRYVVPSVLGVAVIFTELVVLTGTWSYPPRAAGRLAWGAFLGVLAAWPVARAMKMPPTPVPGRAEILDFVPEGVPVVVDEVYYFNPLTYRDSLGNRPVYYLLDWESAIDPSNNWDVAPVDRLLSEWAKLGYARNVLSLPEFACTRDRWVIIHTAGFLMFERRIAVDTAFETKTLHNAGNAQLIQVDRKPGRIPRFCSERESHAWRPPTGPGSLR